MLGGVTLRYVSDNPSAVRGLYERLGARLLGHGSPATTMAVYAHWIRQDVGAAAEALRRFYGRG